MATETLPALLPSCRLHGPMELRPGHTPEQRWCGTWYECTTFGCRNAFLLESPELRAQLDAQRAA